MLLTSFLNWPSIERLCALSCCFLLLRECDWSNGLSWNSSPSIWLVSCLRVAFWLVGGDLILYLTWLFSLNNKTDWLKKREQNPSFCKNPGCQITQTTRQIGPSSSSLHLSLPFLSPSPPFHFLNPVLKIYNLKSFPPQNLQRRSV